MYIVIYDININSKKKKKKTALFYKKVAIELTSRVC